MLGAQRCVLGAGCSRAECVGAQMLQRDSPMTMRSAPPSISPPRSTGGGIDQPMSDDEAGAERRAAAHGRARSGRRRRARARAAAGDAIAGTAVHRQRRDGHQVIGAETVQEAQEQGGQQKRTSDLNYTENCVRHVRSESGTSWLLDRPLHRDVRRQVADLVVARLVAERALDRHVARTSAFSVTSCAIRNGFA